MAIITLTTDFGVSDAFAAQMKGVALGIAPDAAIVDLTHEIPPQDIVSAALVVDSAADAFPAGTVHVAVVDPGVGSTRRAVAIATEREILVGPDNGVFTVLLDRRSLAQAVALTNPAYHREPVSATFHGRDIFAPAAAHLARGVSLYDLGEPALDLVLLDIPRPRIDADAIDAHVLRIDRFGNLITDLCQEDLDDWLAGTPDDRVAIEAGSAVIGGLSLTFCDVPPSAPVAYIGSSGRLEIGVNGGRAAEVLCVELRGAVRLTRQ